MSGSVKYTASCSATCMASATSHVVTTCCETNNCNNVAPADPSLDSCYVTTTDTDSSYPTNGKACESGSSYCMVGVINKEKEFLK